MNKAKLIAIMTLVLAAFAAGASLLLPTPSTWQHSWFDLHDIIAISVAFTITSIGAATLFLLGLKGFKTQLKIAYTSIAIGAVLAAICLAQLPVVSALDLWRTFWMRSGFGALPFLLGAAAQYFGIRLWAKQLQIRTLAANWGVVAAVIAAGILLFALLPHAHNPLSERDLDMKLAIYAWIIFFNIMSVMLLVRMREHAGKAYKLPQKWLIIGLLTNALALASGAWTELLGISSTELYRPINLADELLGIASIMYIRIGYLFNRIGMYEENAATEVAPDASAIDVIFFMADLTSDPRQIDEYLDKMRQMTATHQEGRPLSDNDKATLTAVFNQIQNYLITKEPVRTFTQPGLHQLLQKHFSSETLSLFYAHQAAVIGSR